jgi:tyrosinase
MRTRKNILSLSDKELQAFIRGLERLKSGSKPDQPSRYDSFTQLHYVAAEMKTPWVSGGSQGTFSGMQTQPHNGPAFLPWHRLFIYEFEKALGNAMNDASFGLPYWDWSAKEYTERFAIFASRSQAYMGGVRVMTVTDHVNRERRFVIDGPFGKWYQWRRTGATTMHEIQWDLDLRSGIERDDVNRSRIGVLLEPLRTKIDNLFQRTEYDTSPWSNRSAYLKSGDDEDDNVPFRPQLEGVFHDIIHRWVGGMGIGTWGMGSLASPNDPIFYLHHSNIDRLWARWQGIHGIDKYAPRHDGPPSHRLNDAMSGLPNGSDFLTPAQALDYYGNLGYKYDDVPAPLTRPAPPASHPTPHPAQAQNAALANGGAATPGLPAQHQQANIVHNNALV